MASLLDTLAATLTGPLVNGLLDLDPVARADADALAGRCALLRLSTPPVAMLVTFTEGRVLCAAPGDEDADTCDLAITATPHGLLDVLEGRAERASMSDGLDVRGDRDLADALLALVRGLSPDLEAPLARVLGDVGAHTVGRAVRRTARGLGSVARQGAAFGRERLTGADGPLPERAEVMRQLDAIDDLRLDTDRLEARIARLERTRSMQAPPEERS